MSDMPTTTDREARNSARRLARTGWKTSPEEYCSAADLQVGDFLVRIPQQSNVRGAKIESTVTATVPTWNTWRLGRTPIQSVSLSFGTVQGYDVPADFTVVRRPAAR